MTLTQDRWGRPDRRGNDYYYRAHGAPPFGSSSRGGSRGFFDSLFDEEPRRPVETFRTVCVRTCDGYYFPISFSVTADHFEHDRQVCENSCGAQGRLFVYRNPGSDLEDMRDLKGKAYREMRTAFLYRTEYVSDCKCKPHPWEQQAKDQHRAYALATAKRKGDKTAAAELAVLEAKLRDASVVAKATTKPPKTASLPQPASDYRGRPGANVAADQRWQQDDREARAMRLGGQDRRISRNQIDPRRSQSIRDREREWARRSFWRDF